MPAPRSGLQPPADPSPASPDTSPDTSAESILTEHIALADDLARLLALYIELAGHARRLALDQIAMRHAAKSRVCIGCGETATENSAIAHSGSCPAANILRLFHAIRPPQRACRVHEFYEPWSCSEREKRFIETTAITDVNGRCVVDMYGSDVSESEEGRYARRIAACVNFCAGMPTEELEARKVAA